MAAPPPKSPSASASVVMAAPTALLLATAARLAITGKAAALMHVSNAPGAEQALLVQAQSMTVWHQQHSAAPLARLRHQTLSQKRSVPACQDLEVSKDRGVHDAVAVLN